LNLTNRNKIILAILFIITCIYSKGINTYIFGLKKVDTIINNIISATPSNAIYYIIPICLIILLSFSFINNKYFYYSVILFCFYMFKSVYEIRDIIQNKDLYFNKSFYTSIFIIVLFVSTYKISLIIKKRRKNSGENSTSIVSQDLEINNIEEDLREDFSILLESFLEILEDYSGKSLSIAITGRWGCGKSSFINVVKNSLSDYIKYDIINFYPWRCSSVDHIIKTFFNLLINNFEDDYLEKIVNKYISTIISTNNILNSLFNYDNQNDFYIKIDEYLASYNKKILVFIDDLDRLDAEELYAVLKIIRNSARFSNIIYVTAFDKENTLKVINKDKDYLEKFFQFERIIPPLHDDQKKHIVKKLLKKNYKGVIFKVSEEHIESYKIYKYFDNIRDIKKYISKLNVLDLQYRNYTCQIKSIISKHTNNSYHFKYLDEMKLNIEQFIKINIIVFKYPSYLNTDTSYLKGLKDIYDYDRIARTAVYYEDKIVDKKENEINRMISQKEEYKMIFENDDLKELFKILFKSSFSEDEITFNENIYFYLENFSTFSLSISNLLVYECKKIIEKFYKEETTFESVICDLNNTAFKSIQEEQFKYILEFSKDKTDIINKMSLLKLLNEKSKKIDIDKLQSHCGNIYTYFFNSSSILSVKNELLIEFDKYINSSEIDPLFRIIIINSIFRSLEDRFSKIDSSEVPTNDFENKLITKAKNYIKNYYQWYVEINNTEYDSYSDNDKNMLQFITEKEYLNILTPAFVVERNDMLFKKDERVKLFKDGLLDYIDLEEKLEVLDKLLNFSSDHTKSFYEEMMHIVKSHKDFK